MVRTKRLAEPYILHKRKNDDVYSMSTRNDRLEFKMCARFVCKMLSDSGNGQLSKARTQIGNLLPGYIHHITFSLFKFKFR